MSIKIPSDFIYMPKINNTEFGIKNKLLLFTSGFKNSLRLSSLYSIFIATFMTALVVFLTSSFTAAQGWSETAQRNVIYSAFAFVYVISVFTIAYYSYKAEGITLNGYFNTLKHNMDSILVAFFLLLFVILLGGPFIMEWAKESYVEMTQLSKTESGVLSFLTLPFTTFEFKEFYRSVLNMFKMLILPVGFSLFSYFIILHSQVLMLTAVNPNKKENSINVIQKLIAEKTIKMNKVLLFTIMFGALLLFALISATVYPVIQEMISQNLQNIMEKTGVTMEQLQSGLTEEQKAKIATVITAVMKSLTLLLYAAGVSSLFIFYFLLKVKMRSIMLLYIITENYEDYETRLTEPTEDMFVAKSEFEKDDNMLIDISRQITYGEWKKNQN